MLYGKKRRKCEITERSNTFLVVHILKAICHAEKKKFTLILEAAHANMDTFVWVILVLSYANVTTHVLDVLILYSFFFTAQKPFCLYVFIMHSFFT